MQDAEIYARLTAVFRKQFDDDSIVLSAETTADNVEDWDSFNHIRLIVAVEKSFGVKFATSEIAKFENVGQLAQMVTQKLG